MNSHRTEYLNEASSRIFISFLGLNRGEIIERLGEESQPLLLRRVHRYTNGFQSKLLETVNFSQGKVVFGIGPAVLDFEMGVTQITEAIEKMGIRVKVIH